MEKGDPQPKTKPAGYRPPPRPPTRAGVGLYPEGEDSGRKPHATITKVAEGEGKFIRHSGGRGQYGHVIVKVEPNGRGKGIVISSETIAGAIPVEYIKPVTDGIREALDGCLFIGHPVVDGKQVVDIVVCIVGGSSDKSDSNEMAFKLAGIFAIRDAIKNAGLIAIE